MPFPLDTLDICLELLKLLTSLKGGFGIKDVSGLIPGLGCKLAPCCHSGHIGHEPLCLSGKLEAAGIVDE